jgi:hypothetical protein
MLVCKACARTQLCVPLPVSTTHCRLLPGSFSAAGRWDLHTAITRAGGYKEVGRLLNRRPSWPVPKDEAALLSLPELGAALAEAAAAEGIWSHGQMPSVPQLQLAGRQDLVQVRASYKHKG